MLPRMQRLQASTIVFPLGLLATSLLIACNSGHQEPSVKLDILFTGGLVFAGRATDMLVETDVGIKDGEIVFVGDADAGNFSAARILDAQGLIIAPGFIDPHTHSEDDLLSESNNSNLNYIMQGVTTVFNGNDGDGPALLCDSLDLLDAADIGTNTAFFVGHGEIRSHVMGGDNRAPTVGELEQMSKLVDEAMRCGALGLSTGLYYVPGNFAATDEIVELARVAAKYNGVYDTHLRDESTYNVGVLDAVEETLLIGREADIPVHISHIKALGVDVWGFSEQIIAKVERARENGQLVTANQYPWRASGTHLRNALLPRAYLSGDSDDYLNRLADPDEVNTIRPAMAENLRRRGGADSILIVDLDRPDISGKTLEEIASTRERDELDCAVDIMLQGSTRIASFNMNKSDIDAFVVRDWVMTSSDGTDGHPRKYASFPKKYQDFVVDRQLLTVEEYLYRSSGLTAETFGLHDRGKIAVGYAADVIAFDPDTFAPVATFAAWNELSEGIVFAVINGQIVVENSHYENVLAGSVIRLRQNQAEN